MTPDVPEVTCLSRLPLALGLSGKRLAGRVVPETEDVATPGDKRLPIWGLAAGMALVDPKSLKLDGGEKSGSETAAAGDPHP
jgi:hypothetical protein